MGQKYLVRNNKPVPYGERKRAGSSINFLVCFLLLVVCLSKVYFEYEEIRETLLDRVGREAKGGKADVFAFILSSWEERGCPSPLTDFSLFSCF